MQIFVDELAVFIARIREQPLDDVCGHLLDEVHIVVHIHVVQNKAKLVIADRLDDALLHIAFHVGKRLRSEFLRHKPEQAERGLRRLQLMEFRKHLCDVHSVHFQHGLLYKRVLLLLQKHKNLCDHFRVPPFRGGPE